MPLTSTLLLTLALTAGPERVLVCRPTVQGDAALARPDAVAEAVRPLTDLFLDYGVPCESLGEAARAASRAGLGHAVLSSADGQAEGARFLLVLTTAQADELARRALQVPSGGDAAGAVRQALRELERQVPRPPPRWPSVAGWTLLGVGAVALAGGAAFAVQARSEARQANTASTPQAYQVARDAWQRERSRGAASLAVGGAALAAGLTLRLAF